MTQPEDNQKNVQGLRVEMLRDFATKQDVNKLEHTVNAVIEEQATQRTSLEVLETELKGIGKTLNKILDMGTKAFWIVFTPLLIGGVMSAAYFMLTQAGML